MTVAPELPNPDDLGRPWSVGEPTPESGWLSDEDLAEARGRLPMVYVDAVPVRVDASGDVVSVGLLLRMDSSGFTRALVGGRVNYHERIRDALVRHIEKDLGPMALPQIPSSPQPFTVAEYFPTPGITPFHDVRQHAVSLAYVVPVAGDCHPSQTALDFDWITPEEACSDVVQAAFVNGQGTLVKQALHWCGRV
ncbi:MAG: NUDIX hydrolase family protein [Cellulomonadaceae bacterium]|jgi:ADP-ribose pyrophosphatase YjhB (NUDIX family)|nr:NUDIX hydrolase family protein [Cellulomonadaceae bacterium]